MADHSKDESGRRRGQRPDPAHEQALLRALAQINERTWRELGPLPPGGLPVVPKRKPQQLLPVVPLTVAMLAPSDEDTTMQWKSMTAVVVLATGSALSACGAEGTAARIEPTTVAVSDAVEVAPVEPMPASAAVSSTAEAAETKPAGPNDEEAPEPVRGPAIPAAQLRQQILGLLGSFEKLEDLEHGNVERAFGVRMNVDPEASNGYTYLAETTEGWTYWIDISRLNGKDNPSSTYIHLDNGAALEADPPVHCTFDFEPLAKELVAMGYSRTDRMLRLKGNQWWGFRRENLDSRAAIGAMVYVYRIPDDESGRYCIKSISFGGDPLDG